MYVDQKSKSTKYWKDLFECVKIKKDLRFDYMQKKYRWYYSYFTIQSKTSLNRRILMATLVTYILCFRVGHGDTIGKPLNIYFLLLYRYLISKLINTMISFILWHVFANKDLDKVPTNLLKCQTLLSIYDYFLSGRSMLEAKGPTISTTQIIYLVTRK